MRRTLAVILFALVIISICLMLSMGPSSLIATELITPWKQIYQMERKSDTQNPSGTTKIYHSTQSVTPTQHLEYNLETTITLGARVKLTKIRKSNNHNPDNLPLHELSQHEPHRSRMIGIRRRCFNSSSSRPHEDYINLSRFIFDDKHKVVMCVVPKNACSTLKRFMYYFHGTSKLNKIPMDHLILGTKYMKTFASSKLKKQEIEHKLNTYTKFMVARHPIERLVSAYKNKFTQNYTKKYVDLGKEIASSFLQKRNFSTVTAEGKKYYSDLLTASKHGNITFKVFLQYLQSNEKDKENYDIHWREQTSLCNPCAIDYDFIIDFNSLSEDGEKLLEYLQRNDEDENKVHFPPPYQPPVNESEAKKMLGKIEGELLSKMENIYKNDLYLFNYGFEHF